MNFTISKPIVFFSVDKNYRVQDANIFHRIRIERVFEKLDIPYQKGIGHFNGNVEVSYKIAYENFHLVERIVYDITDQDSVLKVDANKAATLLYPNGTFELIGTLVTTSQHQAQQAGDFSIFDNRFFTVI